MKLGGPAGFPLVAGAGHMSELICQGGQRIAMQTPPAELQIRPGVSVPTDTLSDRDALQLGVEPWLDRDEPARAPSPRHSRENEGWVA